MSGNSYWELSIKEYNSNLKSRKVPSKDLEAIQNEYKRQETVKKINRNQKTIEALNAKYGADRDGKKKRKPRKKKGA